MPDPESRRLDGQLLAFMRKYSQVPAPELAFEMLALRIFAHQFRRNTHYRKFCQFEKKDPSGVRSWKDIPAMPALAFKELVLTSFPMAHKIRIFRTSGTTGGGSLTSLGQGASAARALSDAPLRGAHFFDTLVLYESAILPPFRKYLLAGMAKPAYYFLISPVQEVPDSSLSYMTHVLDRVLAGGGGKFYVRRGRPRFEALASDLRQEKKKVVLLSTAFALKGFLGHLASNKMKLRLAPGSRLMETGGFKGRAREISKNKLFSMCGALLGIPLSHCVSEYGMTELSSQMYGRTNRSGRAVFQGPAWLRTMVIDPRSGQEAKKGQTGVLRHVDLANRGSIIALQTEDLGRVPAGRAGASGPSAGSGPSKGFELLGRAAGSELRGCSLSYEEFLRKGE